MMNDNDLIFVAYCENSYQAESTCEVQDSGSKHWYAPGRKLHRLDGPAVEFADGGKSWYVNNKLHRDDGPAGTSSWGTNYWWLHGIHYNTPEEWAAAVFEDKKQEVTSEAINNFLRSILAKQTSDLL